MTVISIETLLAAYSIGIFPMADSADATEIYWVEPERRGIFPLDAFHVPRRLARTVRQMPFEVTVNRDFRAVMRECAAPRAGRRSTWINRTIVDLFSELHYAGHAHSSECWQDGKLVGGLYGVAFDSVFCGESMFSRVRDASKVALVHLVARLIVGGFTLLDAQFITPHLASLGAIEIDRLDYLARLEAARGKKGDFYRLPVGLSGAEILQSITQTS